MGTRIDCLKLTLMPETQAHCRWGSPSLRLATDSDTSVVDDVRAGGASEPSTPQVNQSLVVRTVEPGESLAWGVAPDYLNAPPKDPVGDNYRPAAPISPWDAPTSASMSQISVRFGKMRIGVGAWVIPTGLSTFDGHPISVDMERWKNGGTPWPSDVEYQWVGGVMVFNR